MTTTAGAHIVPREPPQLPELRAADRGVAHSLESVLSDHTRRTYGTQWRIFTGWCDEVGLRSLPAEPLTVARYLAARANTGASIATLRLATSAISKAHEWAKLESPCRDPGVRASLKGWGRRLPKPQRQSGALTADVLAVMRLTAVQPRKRGRGFETPEQAAERARFDVALVAVISDAGLRRSEAAALTWGDVQRWDDGSGRIRGPLQDRRRGPGRDTAGGGWWRGEGVRAVGVPDRPAGEGDRQGRGAVGLGVLQRTQRARRHGPPHGPERRAHPRDRAPGPLEAGRRHGRPLHPRRVRRIGAAVFAIRWSIPGPAAGTAAVELVVDFCTSPRTKSTSSSTACTRRGRATNYQLTVLVTVARLPRVAGAPVGRKSSSSHSTSNRAHQNRVGAGGCLSYCGFLPRWKILDKNASLKPETVHHVLHIRCMIGNPVDMSNGFSYILKAA